MKRVVELQCLGKARGDAPQAIASPPDLLAAALERLEETIDQENAVLQNTVLLPIGEFNGRKSQSLLELSRIERLLKGGPVPERLVLRIDELRAKLELNQWLLHLHLEAAREIVTIIANAIRDAESDGTYTNAMRPLCR